MITSAATQRHQETGTLSTGTVVDYSIYNDDTDSGVIVRSWYQLHRDVLTSLHRCINYLGGMGMLSQVL